MTSSGSDRTSNAKLLAWVDEWAALCKPDKVHWCDGSQEEYDLLSQEMVVVGTGRPTGRAGATLWAQGGDIANDAFGLSTAKDLGRRVVEVAVRLAAATK